MEKFVASIRRKYQERRIQCEEQWPPVRGDRLLNLQLVEAEKEEGFRAGLPQHGAANEIMFKRTPILYDNLFTTEIGKKPVRKIVVEGNAGMGKTTMCTMLAEGWAKDKILTQFDCVLVLPLRDRRVSSATSLSELFKLLHPSEKIHMAAIEYIEEREGEGVLIIADGWDEIEDCQSKHSFLYDLFFGGVLSFASVLLTSRPSASAPFHNYPSVDRLVEVVGFSEKNVKQYIQSEFEKFPEKASSLIEELENNPVIQSVCSVPLNCAIVCNLWHILDQSLPRTLTELYTKIFLSIIFRNVKKKFPERIIGLSLNSFDEIPDDLQHEFWLICEFAHECLLLDQLVFSEAELATRLPAVSKKFHCFGLLQSARSLLPVGHSLSFHFIHLTIQEFLAALHLVTLSNEKKLKVIENHSYMHNYRFDMMWKFMFGLGSNQTVASSSKKVIVFTIVVFDHFIQKKYVKNFLCHAAFEALHPLYATIVCNIYRSHLLFVSSSTLFDCVVYFHVLRHMKQCDRMGVAVFDCGLTDKVLKELTDILSEANGKLQVTSVDLGSNKLSSKGIADLFTRAFSSFSAIEILNIASNNITSMKSLMDISCSHLIHLDLSENPLGVTGLQSLEAAVQAAMLRNLSTLTLSNTLTDDTDINGALLATFLPSLASRCHKLRKLDLSGNNLCAQGLCTLAENIPIQLEMLFLRDTLIADVCPNESIDLQLQRCDPLRCLESVDLSGCNFNGRSLVIAKFMQSLEVLVCLDCSLISTDIVTLMSGLKMANVVCKSLIEWNLSNNDIDDEGVITLAENIPELFPSLKGFSTPNGVIIHGNPAGEELVYMCNSQLEAIEESLETAVFGEWERTCLPPQNKRRAQVFYKLWDVLFSEMIDLARLIKMSSPSTSDDDNFTDKSLKEQLALDEVDHSSNSFPGLFICSAEGMPRVISVHTAGAAKQENTVSVSAVTLDKDERVTPAIPSSPSLISPYTELTLSTLDKELKTLTKPIQFGISLDISQEQLEIIQQDNRFDTVNQKIALFQYIAKNYKTLGITWSHVVDALCDIDYGDLSEAIREKYCSE